MNANDIKIFIETFCTEVSAVPYEDTELMMDNHRAIKYEEVEYYMPENSVLYTQQDEKICDYLYENFCV